MKRLVMIWVAKWLRSMTEMDSPDGYDMVLYQKITDWLDVQKETAR